MRSPYRLKYALWMNDDSKLLDAVALY
jgi:hypothetical protein